ncbi:MAG: hypothetical protein ACLF0G_14795 [Candidatus Brocadiia bacterium]
MICGNCGHDSPRRLIRLVVFLRRKRPFVEFASLCPLCRRELGIGAGNRLAIAAVAVLVLGLVAAAGFAIVTLVQWLLLHASTS